MPYTEQSYLGLSSAGFHNILYNDWGPKDGPIIVAVHGITCNRHDFDPLARALAEDGYRFIAVDLPGRGGSDNLLNPMDYTVPYYATCITTLFAHLDITAPKSVDFLGVSLGGLIGIVLAGIPNSPIKRFIINDVGPAIPDGMMSYIGEHILKPSSFETVQDLENDMRANIRNGWGDIPEELWHEMAEHGSRALDDGNIAYNYDPAIAVAFNAALENTAGDLWPLWDQIGCPTLLVRGAKSKVLPLDIAQEMSERRSNMDTITFDDCAHVPSMIVPPQIEAIKAWLKKT